MFLAQPTVSLFSNTTLKMLTTSSYDLSPVLNETKYSACNDVHRKYNVGLDLAH